MQTGISKKLRDHLWDDVVFVDVLERVEMEIAEAMLDVFEDRKGGVGVARSLGGIGSEMLTETRRG